jgi:hypothetical protein
MVVDQPLRIDAAGDQPAPDQFGVETSTAQRISACGSC